MGLHRQQCGSVTASGSARYVISKLLIVVNIEDDLTIISEVYAS